MIRCCLVSLTITIAMAVSPNTTAAQADTDSLAAQVDRLFAQLDDPDSPGCACAVMRNGEIVFSGAYGMANLEHDVPLTPQSVFFVESMTKQFTAAAIALLALRGQLSLDHDIRTYLPEMADVGETVTIRHLVHHASGLRGSTALLYFAGTTLADYNTNARTVALLSRQRGLNFRPGEDFEYENSNYDLLAEIVVRVTGTSLREFAEENLFGPLGMANTHFDDSYGRTVKHRAQSYRMTPDGEFRRSPPYMGSGVLLSTAEDLLRWNRNFDEMTVGGPDFIELILTRGILNNGDTLDYAFGISHEEYRGLKVVRTAGPGRDINVVGGAILITIRCQQVRRNRAETCQQKDRKRCFWKLTDHGLGLFFSITQGTVGIYLYATWILMFFLLGVYCYVIMVVTRITGFDGQPASPGGVKKKYGS